MYNIDEIKELIAVLEESSLSVLEVACGDNKVRLEKAVCAASAPAAAPAPIAAAPAAPAPAAEPAAPAAENGKTVNAPIVGVFYAAPSPDSDPYVSVGKRVRKGDVLCIIEAIAAVKAIEEGVIPPTINLDEPDDELDLNYTPHTAVRRAVNVAASTNLGFGGHDACVVFKKL